MLLGLTVVWTVMIWNLTFAHLYKGDSHEVQTAKDPGREQPKPVEGKAAFQKQILDSEKTVKLYLGYQVLEQKQLLGHFHIVDIQLKPDTRNYCISCHGDIPHDKFKDLRAFGNMHASFIACQTCHIRLEGDQATHIFKWYDRATGQIVPSPVKDGALPGTYNAKIIPFERVDGALQRIDSQARIDFAAEYRKQEQSLSEVQKSKAKKIIHQQVSKQPYMCESCHVQQGSLLPFEELGYSKQRIDAFVGTEVIGMIKNYTQFYLPHILEPGIGSHEPEKKVQ